MAGFWQGYQGSADASKAGPNETPTSLQGLCVALCLDNAVSSRAGGLERKKSAPAARSQGGAREEPGRGALPGGGANTDLHSTAGVRPKFGHSLEHIALRKKPLPPGKETGAGGLAAPRRGPLLPRGPRRRVLADGERVSETRGAEEPPTPCGGWRPGSPFSPAHAESGAGGRWRLRAQARRAGERIAPAPGCSCAGVAGAGLGSRARWEWNMCIHPVTLSDGLATNDR